MANHITLGGTTYEFPQEGGLGRARDAMAWAIDVSARAGQGTRLAYLNVKDFGAKGDGVTNDTVAIQSALTTLQNNSTSHVLYFPEGTYIITDELRLAGVYSKAIVGACRSIIQWKGNDNTKYMMRWVNNSTCQIRQMNFWNFADGAVTYPCAGALFQEHASTPAASPGQNYFELFYVQGDFVGGAFENGIVCGGAIDSNNDHHRYVNCRIEGVKHTAYDNQFASQATDHTFIGCFFYGGDGYGVQSRSAFYWFGGTCVANDVTGQAAFRQTSTNSVPGSTVIHGCNCESVQRVLVVGANYPDTTAPAAPSSFSLIGVRWATGTPRVDGVQPVNGGAVTLGTTWTSGDLDGTNGTVGVIIPIWMNVPGSLNMSGCKFEMGTGAGLPRRVVFRVASVAGCAISAHGNQFAGDNFLVQPFIIGDLNNTFAKASAVDVAGNWYSSFYTDTVGGPTPDGSNSHACADLVLSPRGSIRATPGPVDLQQTVAYSSALAFDTALGSTAHVGTLTGNVSTISINNGRVGGERFRIIFKQDATGSRTIPSSWTGSNTLFEGGTRALSTTANTVDMIEMVWDGTLSFWICSLRKNFS